MKEMIVSIKKNFSRKENDITIFDWTLRNFRIFHLFYMFNCDVCMLATSMCSSMQQAVRQILRLFPYVSRFLLLFLLYFIYVHCTHANIYTQQNFMVRGPFTLCVFIESDFGSKLKEIKRTNRLFFCVRVCVCT